MRDKYEVIRELTHIEEQMREVVNWIQYKYANFQPTEGAIDVKTLELSRRLDKYAYLKQVQEQLLRTYESILMSENA